MLKLDLTFFGFPSRSTDSTSPWTEPANDNDPLPSPPRPPSAPLPIDGPQAEGEVTDLRQVLGRPLPSLSHDELYQVEATTWGLDAGYVPAPCTASKGEAVRQESGLISPALPPVTLRHPPRPFRLFDEVTV